MKGFEGYTGKLAESEVLGETPLAEQMRKMGYLSYRQSADVVRELQPNEDPSDPEKPFPRDVHATLASLLKLEDYSQLRFYTAVGSTLDRFHGVDAFFELDLGNGRIVIATIDITQNPHKDDYRADVVFKWPKDGVDRKEDKNLWEEKVAELAQLVLETFKIKTDLQRFRSLSKEELERSRWVNKKERGNHLKKLRHIA